MKNKLKKSNITKNRMRVALLLVLATSVIGLAPAFSSSARTDYSINDVRETTFGTPKPGASVAPMVNNRSHLVSSV